MSRFTKSSLIAKLEELNAELKSANSPYSFQYNTRSGYHAVDLYNADGKCVRNIDCNETPRKLAERAEDESSYYIKEAQAGR